MKRSGPDGLSATAAGLQDPASAMMAGLTRRGLGGEAADRRSVNWRCHKSLVQVWIQSISETLARNVILSICRSCSFCSGNGETVQPRKARASSLPTTSRLGGHCGDDSDCPSRNQYQPSSRYVTCANSAKAVEQHDSGLAKGTILGS